MSDSTLSIARLAGFSVGASKKRSLQPFSHEVREADERTGGNSWLTARYAHATGEWVHAYSLPRTGGTPNEQTQALVVRLVCHLLVDRMPDRALPELTESLSGMWHFYESLPPTEVKAIERATKAVSVSRVVRPSFAIDED